MVLLQFLIVIHVLAAIIGIGPTFFGHVLLRKEQSVQELRHSLATVKKLEIFPKVGGSLAVITGFILYFVGDYGSFMQLWLIGTLILYILIQLIVIVMVGPKSKKLRKYLADPNTARLDALPDQYRKSFNKINQWYWLASTMGVLIFIFMILKPASF